VGLAEHVDKRADALSGGQRQRVGIARALLQNPDLLLVDEPTASLDPKTSRQIMRLITEVCAERGLAAIINIHDVALAQLFVRRIVGLRQGEVVYDGPRMVSMPKCSLRFTGLKIGAPLSAKPLKRQANHRPINRLLVTKESLAVVR
jgi:phosphonate transport system ATP-binding protein